MELAREPYLRQAAYTVASGVSERERESEGALHSAHNRCDGATLCCVCALCACLCALAHSSLIAFPSAVVAGPSASRPRIFACSAAISASRCVLPPPPAMRIGLDTGGGPPPALRGRRRCAVAWEMALRVMRPDGVFLCTLTPTGFFGLVAAAATPLSSATAAASDSSTPPHTPRGQTRRRRR